jgi:branched-chain amino acid transport system substrate-binding protein
MLGVLMLGGVYAASTKPDTTGPVTIGFVGPLSGDLSSIGTVAKAAVEVAVEEINTTGGINGRPLRVVYEDGRCDPTAASSAALKLITIDKVSALIGGACSSETSAFVKQIDENKVPTVSYCSSAPALTGASPYFFRNYPSNAYQGAFMADYAYTKLGAREVAILYHVSDAYTPIKDIFTTRFEALGGRVVAVEGASQDARDYKTQLTKVGTAVPFIYMPTYPDGGTVALMQAKSLGITAQIFGADAWGDPKLHGAVAGLGRYLYSAAKTAAPNDVFEVKVKAQAQTDAVPACASQAYDALYIVVDALKNAGTNPEKLRDALRATKYDGVAGHVEFDARGDLQGAEYVVKKIENGTSVEVK